MNDGNYSGSTSLSTTITWNAAEDAESGISKYEVAIGTSAGDISTVAWTDVGNVTTAQLNGIFVTGTSYFASIRAVDLAGNISAIVSGDGWAVDSISPSTPASIDDGVMAFSSSSAPSFSWGASSDANSGLQGYQLAIGTSSSGTELQNWTSIGDILTTTLSGLTLSNLSGATKYYSSVRAVDNAGNVSSTRAGDGWYNFQQSKLAVDNNSTLPRMASYNAKFGNGVAVSEDGLTMVVGAPDDQTDSTGGAFISNNGSSGAGAAFVYIKSGGTWVLQQKLVATGINARMFGDQFGFSVNISGDTVVVGAYGQDFDASGANAANFTGAAYVFTRSSGVWTQQQKLVATGTNARIASDQFGLDVKISGDSIVVGAPGHSYDELGQNFISSAGAAFVFTRSSGVWALQQKLIATGTNARLASSVLGARVGISGDTIVLGSRNEYDGNGANSIYLAGAVYVFIRSGGGVWTQQQKLVATGVNARISSDYFGFNVDISGDTIVVGAYNQDYDAAGANSMLDAGAAYVFTRSAGVWTQQQKLVATGVNARIGSERFGHRVSINSDTIVISSINQGYDSAGANFLEFAGAAFIYTRSAGVWTQQQKLVASGTNARMQNDLLGSSVGIGGDTIAIGVFNHSYDAVGVNYVAAAGAVFTYSVAGSYVQTQKVVDTLPIQNRILLNSELFGSALALSEDGLTMVVGASYDDTDEAGINFISDAGAAYVYIKSAGNWVLQQKLVATGINARTTNGGFGNSVTISNDTIAIGATNQFYDANGANSVFLAGAVFIYTLSAGMWTQQQKVVATGINARMTGNYFGTKVSLSDDTLVVGVISHGYDASGNNLLSSAGAVFIFTRTAGVWTQQQKLVATGTNARMGGDRFGSSVSISGDTVVVGAYGQDYDASGNDLQSSAGAAYVFTRSAGVWSLQQKLVATGTNARVASDNFGYSVSISGDSIVVGSYNHAYDATGSNSVAAAGAAFVFTRSAGVWTQQQKLVATGVNARMATDYFGYNLSISGNTIVVSAPVHDYDSAGENLISSAGAVYVFTRSSGVWTQQLKIIPTGTNARQASDQFGDFGACVVENVATGSWTIVVSSVGQDYDSTGGNAVSGSGAVYVYH